MAVSTVDGKNPAHQLRLVVFFPSFTKFYTSQGGDRRISEPSTGMSPKKIGLI